MNLRTRLHPDLNHLEFLPCKNSSPRTAHHSAVRHFGISIARVEGFQIEARAQSTSTEQRARLCCSRAQASRRVVRTLGAKRLCSLLSFQPCRSRLSTDEQAFSAMCSVTQIVGPVVVLAVLATFANADSAALVCPNHRLAGEGYRHCAKQGGGEHARVDMRVGFERTHYFISFGLPDSVAEVNRTRTLRCGGSKRTCGQQAARIHPTSDS